MAARTPKGSKVDKTIPVEDYEHVGAKRTNNPPAGLAHLDKDETPVKRLSYDPHLDPQMVWAGKVERSEVDVPAPSIHVHEELSAQKIVGSVRRQRLQQPLFDIDELDPDKAVEFYQHDMNWSNRMILGDSLTVMSSLLERERMAGTVQCVFMDPPYGIKYQSNFQPGIGNRNVTDGKDDDLTREPEMIQAYRDTWELGIHSYLTYLRDRLKVVRELLNESGSIFVQIGDENVHRVALLLDEIFGPDNRVAMIPFVKTTGFPSRTIPQVCDYLLWYARDKAAVKYRPLYSLRSEDDPGLAKYDKVELADGSRRSLTSDERRGIVPLPLESRRYRHDHLYSSGGSAKGSVPYEFEGRVFTPSSSNHWKTSAPAGLDKLAALGRLETNATSLQYVRFADDSPGKRLTDIWTDTASGDVTDKRYVVHTQVKVVARCILMATDPGDLVIDPTCGSGTTAFASEQFGRRWITIDTSRVAMSIARERLLTATFPYFVLRDSDRDVDGGFDYKSISRVTLGSLANDEPPEEIPLVDQPKVDNKKTRVSGPFTVEALSRYAINPTDEAPAAPVDWDTASDHVEILLDALKVQGIPRPGSKPAKILSITPLAAAGSLQAEGVVELDGQQARFAVSLGPQFGAVTMGQVSDALRSSIGFELVVFAGFAVSADAQEKLGTGKIGGTDVALLLANPDLLVGDLLKNTKASQTFRLYAAPDVKIMKDKDGFRAEVLGVDSFDAMTGDVTSFGKTGIQAWFLDDDYDGVVFRVSQAFFPVSNSWDKLSRALRGTVDEELVQELHSWTSLPFEGGDHGRVAVRVIANDGNASEIIVSLSDVKK
jgi:adenine-specific DNA-methyltransferase